MTTRDKKNREEVKRLRRLGPALPLWMGDELMEEVLGFARDMDIGWTTAMRLLMRRGLGVNPANSDPSAKPEASPLSTSIPPVGGDAQSPISSPSANRRVESDLGWRERILELVSDPAEQDFRREENPRGTRVPT